MKIKNLLVANRGEIAVRVFKTCQELGIRTVAVYSEADKEAIHVKMADEAVALGSSEPAESYLSMTKILEAAKLTGADAIHPGYGFLSERASFSEACRNAGITFIGPSPESMRQLGDKISAKQLAVPAGVPIVPGYFEPGATLKDLEEAAERVGYPVMLKAAAGGGGRGMRAVHAAAEMSSSFELAKREALNAFGNDEMMLEKLIVNPRHVEVQVLADQHGTVACLFERECSLQRRNQKMLEECPSPAVVSGLVDWEGLRAAASGIAKAAGYSNAGTVEFIVDQMTGDFYFMEVNARLQVEHPVTELVTGLDLVAWQIRVAEGEKLDLPASILAGDRTALQGHAIEVRVLAEDPTLSFAPSVGKIERWFLPHMLGVRIDTGFGPGSEISSFYDSLIAKMIAHGQDRPSAIRKLKLALEEFHVLGIKTNIGFVLDLLDDPEFIAGHLHTGFLERFIGTWKPPQVPEELLAIAEQAPSAARQTRVGTKGVTGAWSLTDGFRN